jgi:hypothetical protein
MDALWLQIVQWLHTVGLHVDAGTAQAVADGAARATQQLDMPSLVALAAALGWASGLRLYAVVFLVGLMGVAGWIALPPGLAVLQHPAVLLVSGFMLLVEFFADKVPWLDSAWDALHAFIRVPAGALLAASVFGFDNAAMAVVAGLLGGSLSATALATKMTTLAAANTSPEPFSNSRTASSSAWCGWPRTTRCCSPSCSWRCWRSPCCCWSCCSSSCAPWCGACRLSFPPRWPRCFPKS